MKKFTKTSFKKFIRENKDKLEIKVSSSFSGMTDGIKFKKGATFKPAEITDNHHKNTLGIRGLWLVNGGDDYFKVWEADGYKHVEVYNCCGKTVLRSVI